MIVISFEYTFPLLPLFFWLIKMSWKFFQLKETFYLDLLYKLDEFIQLI